MVRMAHEEAVSFFCLATMQRPDRPDGIDAVFAKGGGMPEAVYDNVEDCCERCYWKVARP